MNEAEKTIREILRILREHRGAINKDIVRIMTQKNKISCEIREFEDELFALRQKEQENE